MLLSAMDIVLGLEQLRHKYLKPVVGVVMATEEFFVELNRDHPNHMALYIFPESAVNSLVALDRYRLWRDKPVGEVKRFEVRRGAAEELVQEVRKQGREQLTTEESLRLMGFYGIPVVNSISVASHEELERAAKNLSYPVVLKGVAPDLIHKMDAGGVLVDIRGPQELLEAAQIMTESVARYRGKGGGVLNFLIQEYVRGGREVIVGMTHDPKFGPLVMFGLGGIYVETVKDVVFRVPPLTDLEAEEMIRQIRGFSLLRGVRGEAPVDFKALAEILLRFSQLADDLPEIAEIEINPLMVFPQALEFRAVDARVRLGDVR
jgi:acetyltransferase